MPDDSIRPHPPQPSRIDGMDLHVAARLKQRRLQLQIEPQLLDVAISERSGTIERVERGKKRLAASQLYKLAVVLGVSVQYFFNNDVQGDDPDDHKVTELPTTDQKALMDAKRFARALARIPSPAIRRMIGDLLKSLVASKHLPAIPPPPGDQGGQQSGSEKSGAKVETPGGSNPTGSAPCKRTIDSAPDKHWLA